MTVKIEIVEGRIAASIPWRYGGTTRAKKIPGARAKWDKTVTPNKFMWWHYPLAMSTCTAFRKEFGDALVIGPKLTKWAWSERRAADEMEKLRSGEGTDLPRVRESAPKLWAALQTRPFQISGAAFIAKGKRVCLGDEPRLGKTYQALAAVVESGARSVLIACPKTATRSVWERKVAELLGLNAYVAQGTRSQREAAIAAFTAQVRTEVDEPTFLVTNLEMIGVARKYACKVKTIDEVPDTAKWCEMHAKWEHRIAPGRKGGCGRAHPHENTYHPEYKELFGIEWDAIVLDESHHALASRYNVQSPNITQIRMGAVHLRSAKDGLRLAMSGTPFRSSVVKSWGVLNWMRPDVFSSFWQFAEAQFGVSEGDWGSREVGSRPLSMDDFQRVLRPYYLARTKAEVAPQLPPIAYAGSPPPGDPDGPVGVYLEMEGEQLKAYNQMKAKGKAELGNGTLLANGVLAELTRLRQFSTSYCRVTAGNVYPAAPSNKLDWVLEFLDERKALDGKVVIATQFTKLANFMAEQIRAQGWQTLVLTGETSDKQRLHAQDEFLNGRTRVIVINLFAGGEAIDLSSADEMIFLDDPWVDDARQQAENRVQNLAKRSQITIYRLRSAGTVEEKIAALTDEQRRLLMSAKPKAISIAKEVMK